jgi:hypothetical protein
LYNEELHNLHFSPNFIGGDEMKEGMLGVSCSAFGRKGKGRGHMEDIGIDDKIVLKHINPV